MRIGRRVPWGVALGATLALGAACHEPTRNEQVQQVREHRAEWEAHGITSYSYEYERTGVLVSYANHPIRIVVHDGVVDSAVMIETGEAAPGSPAQWPTVDSLFDRANTAAAGGTLLGVHFDPQLGYPTQIEFLGPADGSGSELATNLQPIP
jgi:hypothetical protein